MKNFRILKEDNLQIEVVLNRKTVLPSIQCKGFKNIPTLINFVKKNLDWSIQGKGKRIEIGIKNYRTNQIKYIDTFS